MNLGDGLAARGGASGSFFTGVLAVVVASPCTAPFMGTALGLRWCSPPIGLLVFAALGRVWPPRCCCCPTASARRLAAATGSRGWSASSRCWRSRSTRTALWLFWVAGRQAGVDLMAAALLGALLLAFALWLWNERPVAACRCPAVHRRRPGSGQLAARGVRPRTGAPRGRRGLCPAAAAAAGCRRQAGVC
jgi:hypothetical protein